MDGRRAAGHAIILQVRIIHVTLHIRNKLMNILGYTMRSLPSITG